MIEVVRDTGGLELAFMHLLEEDHARARIDRAAEGASPVTRARLLADLPPLPLAAGYYRFARHILRLEEESRAGITLDAFSLADYEGDGLRALKRKRAEFEAKHIACSACGVRQDNRFAPQCVGCGVRFRRKGDK